MLKSASIFCNKVFYVDKIRFNKPAICVKEQIELLKSRGLIIVDEDFAESILSNITYYRLSAYMKYLCSSFKIMKSRIKN